MTKWEYKTLVRGRRWDIDNYLPDAPWMIAKDWSIDIDKTLKELGDEGWELVAVTSESDYLGGHKGSTNRLVTGTGDTQSESIDYAGFTSHELWVFKRVRPG
jgi:hypothetical protein